MPASFRRLRLPSSLILCRNNKRILYHTHDSRLFIDSYNRRETMLRLVSSSVSSSGGGGGKTRLLSTFFNPSFMDHRQKRRSDTNITTISSSHSHLSPTSIASSISVSSETLTSTLRAHFHSTPLSWFAAENIEEQKKEDATTTTIPTSSNDDGGDGDGDGDDSANVVVDGNDDDNGEPSATDIVYDFTPPAPLSQASQDKVQEILDKVLYLDMIEVHLLTQIVNEQMGISWKETEQRMSGRGGGGVGKYSSGGATDEAPVEEKTIFDLKLLSFDAKAKIKVIKEVRNIAGLGLKEAKEMVEGAPKVVQKELKKEKAEELKTRLEAVGAQMELV